MKKIKEIYSELISEEISYHGGKKTDLAWGLAPEDPESSMLGYGIYLTNVKKSAIWYAKNDSRGGVLYTFDVSNANILDWGSPVPNEFIEKLKSDPNFYKGFQVKPDFSKFDINDGVFKVNDDISFEWDLLTEPLPKWALEDSLSTGYFIHMDNGEIIDGLTKSGVLNYIKQAIDTNQYFPIDIEEINEDFGSLLFYELSSCGHYITPDNVFDSVVILYTYLYHKIGLMKGVSEYLSGIGIDGVKYHVSTNELEDNEDETPLITVVFNLDKFKIIDKIKFNEKN